MYLYLSMLGAVVLMLAGTDLHKAVGSGDMSAVMKLLQARADPNAKDQAVETLGWSPLHVAAHEGHFDAARALLEFGAEVDGEDEKGFKPSNLASSRGHKKIHALLMAREPKMLDWLIEHKLSAYAHLPVLRAMGVQTTDDLEPLRGLDMGELFADIAHRLDGTGKKAQSLPCAPKCTTIKAALHKAINTLSPAPPPANADDKEEL